MEMLLKKSADQQKMFDFQIIMRIGLLFSEMLISGS